MHMKLDTPSSYKLAVETGFFEEIFFKLIRTCYILESTHVTILPQSKPMQRRKHNLVQLTVHVYM